MPKDAAGSGTIGTGPVEAVLQGAARGLVRLAERGEGPVRDALPNVVQGVLMQTGRAAQAVVRDLRAKLQHALESLQQAVPAAMIDVEPVRGFVCRGLPSLELPPGLADLGGAPPWWTRLLPGMAMRLRTTVFALLTPFYFRNVGMKVDLPAL